ncbi:hypothetical protein [Paraburkholderia sp. RL17-347-BIC-D]|jgi:hypothetical protein|uniref:hypothetical protein n=1 Tax=Paraburkholderia sp. RL17-347-BIC-D TaxID=3031632 RepID=UPI0038BCFE00
MLAGTGEADWKIVPARQGGADEIRQLSGALGRGNYFLTRYATRRFVTVKRQLTRRQRPGRWKSEGDFPKRRLLL